MLLQEPNTPSIISMNTKLLQIRYVLLSRHRLVNSTILQTFTPPRLKTGQLAALGRYRHRTSRVTESCHQLELTLRKVDQRSNERSRDRLCACVDLLLARRALPKLCLVLAFEAFLLACSMCVFLYDACTPLPYTPSDDVLDRHTSPLAPRNSKKYTTRPYERAGRCVDRRHRFD